jgi:anaerobic dimethyl sulfoxide reductase subunit B (iron-sulfur subunit)
MVQQYAFYFDSSVCSGCKTCQMACKDKHDLDIGLLWRRVYEISGGEWKKKDNLWSSGVFAYNLSIACNHCEDPICIKSCPTKAISKREDGIVVINREECVGCRMCEWQCPYGSPQFDRKSGTMSKCDFCLDLIDSEQTPVCVSACPMRALDFGDLEELKKTYQGSRKVYPLAGPSLTGPSIVIKPHRDAGRAEKEGAKIANKEEV